MKYVKPSRVRMLVACLSASIAMSQAASVTYLSNTTDASWGGYGVNGNWGLGQPFQTGTSPAGYSLNSISLPMLSWSEGVSGFNVSIYSNASGNPATLLETLSGNNDPRVTGLYAYAS